MRTFVYKAVLTTALLCLLLGVAVLPPPAPPPEPSYEGLPLQAYLASQTYGDLRKERQAAEAIRAIGSNAVPQLIRVLNQRESRLKTAFRALAGRQGWVPEQNVALYTQHQHALMACQTLGPTAAPAIPALTGFVHDSDLASLAVRALALAGPQTFPLLTNLLVVGIPEARIEAAGDLRYLPASPDSVAVLVRALGDPHPTVRARAADTLGVIAAPAKVVVPALIQALADQHPDVQHSAVRSLGRLGQQAAEALPALAQWQQAQPDGLNDPILRQALHDIGCTALTAPGAQEGEP